MLAITLQRRDFRENDQIISFYTKEAGKIEPVARGVKKIISKNAPALEPFSLLDIEIVPGKNYSYVTKAFVVENYPLIRTEVEKLISANLVLSLVNKIVRVGERDQNIFKLLHSFLKYLNKAEKVSYLLPAAFVGRVTCFLGFTPVLARCSVCGKTKFKKILFAAAEGGIVCDICAEINKSTGVILSVKLLKKLRSVFTESWKEVGEDNLSKLEKELVSKCIFSYASYHLSVKIVLPVGLF
ncbi:MAG: DNA repair protein RecO [Patescibacteria group bacterium]|jgi:DNA repair protein RecO (recombination protein O)